MTYMRLFSTSIRALAKSGRDPYEGLTPSERLKAIGRVFDQYTTLIDPNEPNDYYKYHMMRLERAEEFKQFAARQKAKELQNTDAVECSGQDQAGSADNDPPSDTE